MWLALLLMISASIAYAQKPVVDKLMIEVVKKVSNCRVPQIGESISVYYTGKFYDTNIAFDSSTEGNPFYFTFGKGRVIQGWELGLKDVCVGEKRKLIIPPELAYGTMGNDVIPPNSVLVFDIEVLTINDENRKSGYKVKSLPLLSDTDFSKLDMYAGHIQVGGDAEYFHILVRPNSPKPTPKKLVIWLNGGPGCSSMDGMFLEIGPIRVKTDASPFSLRLNHDGWWDDYDLVFLDQPAGVGYSVGSLLTETTQVVNNFAIFLEDLLEIYPEYKGIPLYIAGESYAGVYIPYISKRLLSLHYPLKAIIIGNPWLDPKHQYPAINTYSAELGLLPGSWLKESEDLSRQCDAEIAAQKPTVVSYPICEGIMGKVLDASREGGKYCINKYDYTLRDLGPNDGCGMAWPDGVVELGQYLPRDDVKKALHATLNKDTFWHECNYNVFNSLSGERIAPPIELFPELLEKIHISIFAGDKDILCNWVGLHNSFSNLNWGGSIGMATKPDKWHDYGFITRDKNLTFFLLKNASHMSPSDAPVASYQVMKDTILFLDQGSKPIANNSKTVQARPAGTPDTPILSTASNAVISFLLLSCFCVAMVGVLFVKERFFNGKKRKDLNEPHIW